MHRVTAAALIFTSALACTTATPQAQNAAPATTSAFDGARAWGHLQQMVAIGPRPAGSAPIRQTRAYITRQLAALGLNVQEQPFTAMTPLGRVDMVNLILRLPGRRADRILFTGHYDTKLFRDAVFVGASDGASSAAWLIEMARVLASQPHEFTYDFVWFDGEEAVIEWRPGDHTYGSRYYVQAERTANALSGIRANILVDMIGDSDLKIRRDQLSTPWLNEVIWSAAKRAGHGSTFIDAPTEIDDDHIPFMEAGVPSVDIIDLDYPAWHTPDDDLKHVSQRSLQIVGDVVLAALPDIERRLLQSK
jgi:hypothetical protein